MRAVIPSMLVLVLTATHALADATPPPFTNIPREVILEFAEPYAGWTFFAVKGSTVQQLLTTAPIALHELFADSPSLRYAGVELYAVPDGVLAELGKPTSADWFNQRVEDTHLRRGNAGVLSISTTLADPRERVVQRYQVRLSEGAIKLELIEERAEWSWPTVIVMGALSLAIALGGIWIVRRLRHRLVTRMVSPPGAD